MNTTPWSPGMRTQEAIAKIERDSSQEAPNFGTAACSQSSSKRTSSKKRVSKVGRKSGSKAHRKGHA